MISQKKNRRKKRKGKDDGEEEDEHLQRAPGAFLAGVILIDGEKIPWEGSLDHFRDPLGWGGSVAYERIEKERIEKRNKTNKKQAQQKAISHIREPMKVDDLHLPKDPFCPPEPKQPQQAQVPAAPPPADNGVHNLCLHRGSSAEQEEGLSGEPRLLVEGQQGGSRSPKGLKRRKEPGWGGSREMVLLQGLELVVNLRGLDGLVL